MRFGQAILPLMGALMAAALGGPSPSAQTKQAGPFCSANEVWLVRSDAEEVGDRYVVAAGGISMDGLQSGDLFGWAPKISVDGEIQGDLFAGANSIDISGTVRDSTRLFGQTIEISGTIEGDLLIFGATLTLKEGAHITGDIFGSVAHFTHMGRVDGNIRLTTGESRIEGSVGKDLRLKADTINFNEGAQIEGDLIYKSRTELPASVADYVSGEIVHEIVEEDDDAEAKQFTLGTVVGWLYWPVAAFILGSILLALCGKHKRLPVQRMNEEGWTGLAVGVLALPVLAVASVVAMFLVLTIPLGIIGIFLLLILLFIGKIPTAVWLGRRVLSFGRESEPSPYLSLALGLIAIYLLKMIPYLGWLIWYAVTSAGIGAMILAIMALRRAGAENSADA
jgi:cytoskeletal protein CcmA (bactofilin family)